MDRRASSKSPSPTGSISPKTPLSHRRVCGCIHRFLPGEHSSPALLLMWRGMYDVMVQDEDAAVHLSEYWGGWSSTDMLKTMNARTFWEQRVAEEMVSPQEKITEMWQCQENSVWASIYGTIRDRRRSRSRTSSSSVPRSRTPSSVSSGRTTPSPGPYLQPMGRTMSEEVLTTSPDTPTRQICSQPHCKCKYHTKCWLVPRSVPIHYSSTIFIQLGSTKRRYLEEITFQKRLMPRKFSEGMEVATDPLCRCYTSEVTIPCQPHLNVINLEPQQARDSHTLTTVI